MLMKRNASRGRRGFTLTEVAIVLGIMGLILGAVWAAAGAVYRNQRISTTTTQIIQMVNGIRALYATTTAIDTGTQLTDMADAGAVPQDMVVTDGTGAVTDVVNVWNGSVTISYPSGDGRDFQIDFPDVPKEACANIIVRMTGQGRDEGLSAVEVDGAALTINATGVDLTDATGACTDGGSTISFTFDLRS